MTTPSWMRDLGVPDQCVEHRTAAEENGRRFALELASRRPVFRVRVDGCWLTGESQKKVDYLFSIEEGAAGWTLVLLELKGGDFGRALAQIDETLKHLAAQPAFRTLLRAATHAVVVLSHGNRVPTYQQKLEQIRKRHGVAVVAKSRQHTLQL